MVQAYQCVGTILPVSRESLYETIHSTTSQQQASQWALCIVALHCTGPTTYTQRRDDVFVVFQLFHSHMLDKHECNHHNCCLAAAKKLVLVVPSNIAIQFAKVIEPAE
jgi:hypothetical protein